MLTYKEYGTECYVCHTTSEAAGLERHHIYRGINRQTSPTVFLCHKCHRKVTDDRKADMTLRKRYERESNNRKYPFMV